MAATQNPVSVPIRIDAMWSDGTTNLSPPTTQFTDLLKTTDFNHPWLGDTSHITPNSDFTLPTGLHLHWTLPKALRRGGTVYVLDAPVFNELVQQGVPCALVDALKSAAQIGEEYTLDQLNTLLAGLALPSHVPLSTSSDFDLLSQANSYDDLISSDNTISVSTYMPEFQWDAIFLEVYGPMVAHLAARMKLPPVPNRWLVIRKDTTNSDITAWVVESDRLSIPNTDGSAPSGAGPSAVPGEFDASFVANQTAVGKSDAFQFLGLTTPAASWSEDGTAKRLAPFTAVGHGVPDFAAFYPNCQGVFGFYDSTADQDTAYDYTVIGWFAAPTDDPLATQYDVAPWSVPSSQASSTQASSTQASRLSALGWTIESPDWSSIDGSIYTAKISVTGTSCGVQASGELANVDVAIGNTAGEALSAYIAQGQSDPTLGISPEAVLNAAQAGVLQEALQPDGPAIIENALHGQSFQTEAGGWSWQITGTPPASTGLSSTPATNTQVTLTDTVAQALNALNAAQSAFDRDQAVLQSERHLLFTDWCRASHLGTDAAVSGPSNIFPNGDTPANNNGPQLVMVAGNAVTVAAGSIQAASIGGSTDTSMLPYLSMTTLYLAHYAAANALAAMPGGDQCLLRRQPAARYWCPNDPVVMMTEASGNDLQTSPPSALPYTEVKDQPYLTLQVITAGVSPPAYLPTHWDSNTAIPSAKLIDGAVSQVSSVSCAESWRPLSLYWETQFQHFPGVGTIAPSAPDTPPFTVTDYATDFITSNFEQDASGIDFVPKPGQQPSSDNIAFYRGRVTLSNHATQTLRARILQLTGQAQNPPSTSAGLTLPGVLGEGITKTLIDKAYDSDIKTLSQTLNGFNDRLLMLERLPQISIFDPGYTATWNMGATPAWDALSQSFYDEIGLQSRTSPNQDDIYNPIRAGKCEVTSLTLVDAFAQLRQWSYSPQPLNTVISEALPNETSTGTDAAPAFFLAPRFAQGSRLLFRWLAADGSNDAESNQSPATTPVCGWVALNRVDENVMIFTQGGTLIGWIPAGGGDMAYLPGKSAADITDPFLQQVVTQAQAASSTFYSDINTALLTIEPRSHRQHAGRSVLESRPLALARASLQLQLSAAPSPHQGYEAIATMQLENGQNPATGPSPSPYIVRENCGFTGVDFPVRLGDVSMDDDGLVLYWSLASGTIGDNYILVSADAEAGPGQEPTLSLTCAPDAAPVHTLLLLDPRAPVNATSGILPVKNITVPPAMYADAVRNMEYLMQVGPVLTSGDTVAMPLPTEIRGKWSWLYDDGGTWSPAVTPQKTDNKIHPKAAPAVIRKGFLKAGADDA